MVVEEGGHGGGAAALLPVLAGAVAAPEKGGASGAAGDRAGPIALAVEVPAHGVIGLVLGMGGALVVGVVVQGEGSGRGRSGKEEGDSGGDLHFCG